MLFCSAAPTAPLPAVRLWVTDLGLGLGVALLFTYLTLVPAFSWPVGLTSARRASCFVLRAARRLVTFVTALLVLRISHPRWRSLDLDVALGLGCSLAPPPSVCAAYFARFALPLPRCRRCLADPQA